MAEHEADWFGSFEFSWDETPEWHAYPRLIWSGVLWRTTAVDLYDYPSFSPKTQCLSLPVLLWPRHKGQQPPLTLSVSFQMFKINMPFGSQNA